MACTDCYKGTLRSDRLPTGTEEVIHGLSTYVTHPDPGVVPLGTVVIFSDAYGWKLRNTRVLADEYAKRVPCTVYLPDLMDGLAPPEDFLLLPSALPSASLPTRILTYLRIAPLFARFLYHCRFSVVHPRILAYMRAIRPSSLSPSPPPSSPDQPQLPITTSPTTKLACAGFCWGGLHAVRLTHGTAEYKVEVTAPDGTTEVVPLVDCAFVAHPTWLQIPDDIEKVVQPLSVANGDNDGQMGREGMKALMEVLEVKNENEGEGGGTRHEAVVYEGARHGFAVRGDRGDLLQRERGEKSEEQAIQWFQRHFQDGDV